LEEVGSGWEIIGPRGIELDRIRNLTFGTAGDEEWERAILEVMGFSELRRDEVQSVLRTRMDQ